MFGAWLPIAWWVWLLCVVVNVGSVCRRFVAGFITCACTVSVVVILIVLVCVMSLMLFVLRNLVF